jgi:hypothetical protein
MPTPNPKQWLFEQEERARAAKRQQHEANSWIDENDAIRRLTALIGTAAFYAWYESPMIRSLDVPLRIEMMEKRIAEHERSVAKEEAHG